MTQKKLILQHLQTFKSITPIVALEDYSVYRLSAVIKTLRDDGYNITTTLVPHINRFGNINKYAKYTLE